MHKNKKVSLGQFNTTESVWLRNHIKDFIYNSNKTVIYDPFAGEGDILKTMQSIGFNTVKGLDIDSRFNWEYNDSLKNIPTINDAIIITNPPYLAKYSAKRKGLNNLVIDYFNNSKYDDLYLIALEKMLLAQDYVVAIIPETFINSNFQLKERLYSLTIIEDNPFLDTFTPVLVACFDSRYKSLNEVKVYKNDEFINSLGYIDSKRLKPSHDVLINFNDVEGWLGVKCVDGTNPIDRIKFDFRGKIKYDWGNRIKASSRLLTLLQINIPDCKKEYFIQICNKVLETLREDTRDIIFSPFKGNAKNGVRRRRLDFSTCRAIVEIAYNKIKKE